jgi:hypothetical protein
MAQSTPPSTLPPDGKLEANGEKTQYAEHEREKPTVESTEPFTESPSTSHGAENPASSKDALPVPEEKAVDPPQDTPTYPKGMEVFFIMLALVLSITLVSLDQVRSYLPYPFPFPPLQISPTGSAR